MSKLAMSFDEFVAILTKYQDIVFSNQSFLLADPTRTQEVHAQFMATSSTDAPHAAELLRTQEGRELNYLGLKSFCDREAQDLDDRVRRVYACIGLMTHLSQMVDLPAGDKLKAYNLVNGRMNQKHFKSTIEKLKKGTTEALKITRRDTAVLRTHWPLDFTHQDARDLVKNDPFSVAERLYGVGMEGNEKVTWQVTGVAVRRRQRTYEVEIGGGQLGMLDENGLLELVDKTTWVYLNRDM
ncbi:hypothetical protein DXG03_006597 [Asterophora parasitica]|uniref:Uncharacterized protein n=1 Tax=Asterophora parasitica TaxID=117018 RepID=A0A9P7G0X6_9AGAR|nr:hypothetical protein DXG03_006597 [Asterophora parasitica]